MLHTITWLGIALPLLPLVGVVAIGYGWMAGSIVDAFVLGRSAARHSGARLARRLIVPTLCAVAAAASGWVFADSGSASLTCAVGGGAIASCVYLGALFVIKRSLLFGVVRLTGRAVRMSLVRA
jgi:hypothetical protein